MGNQEEKTQHKQQDATKSSKWENVLSGVIFILTVLFILGFFWQSIMSFISIK